MARTVLTSLTALAVCAAAVATATGTNLYNISYGEHRPFYVDIELLSLEAISGKSQTFSADFFVSEAYQDNTHAVHTAPDELIQAYSEGTVTVGANAVYDHVEMEFTNSDSANEQYRFVYASWEKPSIVEHFNSSIPDVVGIPWIRVESRMQGTFKVELSLQQFPFDKQTITFHMESSNHEIHQGEFVIDTHSDMMSIMKPLVEWTVEGSQKEVGSNYYHIFNETYSIASFHIFLMRNPVYYLDKIVSGITMLVVMSWFLFCLPIADSNRQTCGATIFLALVAYIFIVTNDTPKVAYTTKLGSFINLCVSQVFIGYVYFCIDLALEQLSVKAHDTALSEAKKDVKVAKKKYAKSLGQSSAPIPEAMDEDEVEVEGWWDSWDNAKNKVDMIMLTLLVLSFVISTPFLLSHEEGDHTTPTGTATPTSSPGTGGH